MEKKILASIVIAFLFFLTGCNTQKNNFYQEINTNSKENEQKIPLFQSQGDLIEYDSVEELERRSEVIIEGKLINNNTEKVYDSEGHLAFETTFSRIQVKKVFKGDFKNGEILTVVEPYVFDEIGFNSLEGYNKMEKKGKYILFLYKSTEEEYVLSGVSFGKYDLHKKEKITLKNIPETYDEVQNNEYFGN